MQVLPFKKNKLQLSFSRDPCINLGIESQTISIIAFHFKTNISLLKKFIISVFI